MRFIDWVKDFFSADQQTVLLNQKSIVTSEAQLAIELFAVMTAINMISNSVAKCEFKTFIEGQEVQQNEYYTWNIEPNINQNSSEFLKEIITKMLFNNECLVIEINGQLIIADSFYQNEFATMENNFTNVTKGTLTFNKTFRMSEVLYFKYENTEIRLLLTNLIKDYNNLIGSAATKYKRSGGRKGILDIDSTATGNKDFQTRYDDLMNTRFKRYFEAENAVLPLHKGFNYEEQDGGGLKKTVSEIDEIAKLTKEIFDRAGQAFKIPPALLRGDVADVGVVTGNYLTFGIDPIVDLISEEINRKRYGKSAFMKKTYLKIDTTCIMHKDIFKISEAFDKLIASGGFSIDELRIKMGDAPLNTEWSEKHWITKNYQPIESVKGGE